MIEPLAILSYLMARPFGSPQTPSAFVVQSPAFRDHRTLPKKFTCRSKHPTAPPLTWSGAPAGTKSFALLMIDDDASRPKWYQWAVFNIPAGQTEFLNTVSLTPPAQMAANSWGLAQYHRPCPRRKTHHYRIELYALDQALPSSVAHSAIALRKKMQNHILGMATTYSHVRRIKKSSSILNRSLTSVTPDAHATRT